MKYPFDTTEIDNVSIADIHEHYLPIKHINKIELTFMVPCMNEELHVTNVLRTLVYVAYKLGFTYEIIVINDDSTDKTRERVLEFTRMFPNFNIRLIQNEQRQGVAQNFKMGAHIGKGRYYRMVNGDNVEPVETHKAIYSQLGKADLLIPDYGTILNRKSSRTVISRTFTFVVNLVSGLRLNYYNGCPVFQREDIINHIVPTSGLGFSAEMVTKLIWLDRSYRRINLVGYDQEGSTALTFRNFTSVALSIVRIWFRRLGFIK